MRVAVVSDLHSNRPALEAVLEDCPPVDGWLCAGDVVGYGPHPGFCVDVMRERAVPTVLGNHDRAVVTDTGFSFNSSAGDGVVYARRELTDDQRAWLAGLSTTLAAFDGRVAVVHGHPDDPDRYVYPALFSGEDIEAARREVSGAEGCDVLVCGHTHVQGHERFDEGLVLNPGSVGQPRDGDPRAAYAILDLDSLTVEERRVEYDVEAMVDAVRAAGLPEGSGTRLRKGR
ncbi:metallophosphatase family protein [Salinirubellus salinus]|uniref:Metallophosphatase family protein n=1 Tax=Salinirubellus salinus TaxID=1364945 RepID=A0A9E7R0P1_9EURY|nr:metallophosphoesterase family protein [Salinirubellus salinus]UWM53526.1 metallophosphatase family protein [Salinirubellus salinus]